MAFLGRANSQVSKNGCLMRYEQKLVIMSIVILTVYHLKAPKESKCFESLTAKVVEMIVHLDFTRNKMKQAIASPYLGSDRAALNFGYSLHIKDRLVVVP